MPLGLTNKNKRTLKKQTEYISSRKEKIKILKIFNFLYYILMFIYNYDLFKANNIN